MAPLSARLDRKLRRLGAVLPVLAGALVVTALLALAAWLLKPHLPKGFLDFVSELMAEDFEGRKASLKAWFDAWGAVAAWVFLGVQFLQVVLAPIPGQLTGMVGGFVFGFWRGLALNVAGNAVGSLTAMLLTRFFGERVMRPFVPRRIQERFDAAMHRGGLGNFFMLFLLPGTPKDAICFMAGLTRFPVWKLILVNSLGRLPGLGVLTFTGAAMDGNMLAVKLVFGAGLVLALLAWLFDEEIKERLARFAA
ncbi:MAG: VTT domain-containing protein [Proteobacteria bacterium]|nr:VTT domain-containing protein [Pseudomonadota bacterium]MBU1596135.1 VTT domain-containing protein [Pseudomonadota bacterium]